jgi:Leucine-rich repeat (LRR) protein
VANNNFRFGIPESWYKLVNLATLGIAYNPQLNGTLEILKYLPKLSVLFARGCSLTGEVPVPASTSVVVMDLDQNNFNSVAEGFCDTRSNLPALANKGGCDTDWPSQPFGTCCLKSNKCNCDSPPPCLANCQMSCGVPTPPPTPSTCTTGKSAPLAGADCQVWKDLFRDLDAYSWADCASLYSDPCSCKFVKCGFVQNSSDPNSHILALDLSGVGAHGKLPPSISQLKFLRSLDLSNNNITSIPETVCDLPAAALANTTCAMASNPLDCTGGPLPVCVRPCGAVCTIGACMGTSSYLMQTECGVWRELSSQSGWQQANPCTSTTATTRTTGTNTDMQSQDPCACTGKVTCTDDHAGTHIAGLAFASEPAPSFSNVTLPASLAGLSYLTELDFAGDLIGGALPELPFAQYTGKGQGVNISGGGCRLDGNAFICPLPAGASTCKPSTQLNCSVGGCLGLSMGMSKQECAAWGRIFDGQPGVQKLGASMRTDPCSCPDDVVACSPDGKHILNLSVAAAVPPVDGSSSSSLLADVCVFSQLERLFLQGSSLNETLPACIGQGMKSLQDLDLSGSHLLHGPLPSLAGLGSLARLDLSGCAFTRLPKDVCDLPAAALTNTTCAMASNPLDCTGGPLPVCVRPCGAVCTIGACMGTSSYLMQTECGVWWELSSQPGWQQANPCANVGTDRDTQSQDPCACTGKVTCTDYHAGTHIAGLAFASEPAPSFSNVTLPASLAGFSYLTELDFSGDLIGGALPELPFAQYMGKGVFLGGCMLDGNLFECPLPVGAKTRCKPSPPTCGALPTPPPTPPPPTPSNKVSFICNIVSHTNGTVLLKPGNSSVVATVHNTATKMTDNCICSRDASGSVIVTINRKGSDPHHCSAPFTRSGKAMASGCSTIPPFKPACAQQQWSALCCLER